MKSLAICIGKGGQWKTTTTCNMAYLLNEKGYKTLVIDCDPQCNSSLLYGAKVENEATLYDCWIEVRRPINPMECIQHTEKGDIIAGDSLISEITSKIYDSTIKLNDFKSKVLDKIEGYDYVIVDCPPDLTGFINRSVIASVDEVLVTLKGDMLSVKGLADIYQVIHKVKEEINPALTINGMIMINYQGATNNGKNALTNAERIANQLGTKLYNTNIRPCAKGQEAIDKCDFVVRYSPYSNSALDYKKLVDEFINYENN